MNERDDSTAGPVTVMTVRDQGALVVAQSLLEDAGIQYFVKSENATSLTPLMIWVEIQVEPADAEEARALLADLAQP